MLWWLTREHKENPRSHLTGRPQTAEVELPDGHSNCIFNSGCEVEEVPEICTENKEKEAAEGSKHNDKLHHKGRKADETKLDSCSNLSEGFLETEIKDIDDMIVMFIIDNLSKRQSFSIDVKTVTETV